MNWHFGIFSLYPDRTLETDCPLGPDIFYVKICIYKERKERKVIRKEIYIINFKDPGGPLSLFLLTYTLFPLEVDFM
jgi:hypothetical protein